MRKRSLAFHATALWRRKSSSRHMAARSSGSRAVPHRRASLCFFGFFCRGLRRIESMRTRRSLVKEDHVSQEA
ncbi:hypothetical protein BDP67DRAFT_521077 [Colletotrichum lupini]|nr:hypothetical protein BDP67DRAFT_521077 [Colletotrichum lupini]